MDAGGGELIRFEHFYLGYILNNQIKVIVLMYRIAFI